MVSLALARPGQRGLLLVFALLSFMVFAAAGAERASACVSPALAPLALSTFEGGDGDQCDSDGLGARRDWQNVAGNPGLNSTIDAPSDNDTIYGPNTHDLVGGPTDENVPDSWNFQHGSVGSGKFDALAANSFTDPENGKLFLDLGFVRATTSGDTFLAFELNQRQPGYRTDANDADPSSPFKIPTRTRGDLLVTYHVGTAGAQTLGLCIWDGNEHSGQWEEYAADFSGAAIDNQSCPALSTSLYQAAINDGTGGREGAISGAENFLNPGTAIGAGQFGEAVVNLTEALRNSANPDGPQPCVDFGYVWLHSRSSDSLTSSQQDFIMPDKAVSIGNCTVEGRKFNDLNGDGARSADEPYLGGWTIFADYNNNGVLDNNMDGTFVNNMDGIVDPGEEEPYDVTADGTGSEALGTYRITKVQPSNKPSNPSGTWPIREVLQPTWDCTAAVGGGAVLTPNVCPEDTSTNPDSARGFQLAWTDNQIYSGRDFGNRRQPAQLTVVKHVVNDNGGTAAASAWSLHVTSGGADVAGSPKVGSETGDTYSLAHGQTYNVSELGDSTGYHATYSGDCDASGNVTVSAGETKTCTITNNDVAPVLTVVKHVINDNGGTKAAGDFSITVDDQGTNPASFAGAEAPGTDVTIDPGAYTVAEGAHAGYAVSYSAGCDSTLALGEAKTCTITNNDVAPVLTVIKHVINDNGGTKAAGDFSITVDDQGTNPASFAGAEAPGTDVVVDAGAYTVAEGAHAGYAVSYSAGCDSTLAIGETKTCTITNDDIAPVLTVIKHVINDNGGTKAAGDFSITVDDQGTNPASFAGAETPGTDVVVDAGAYTASEGAHAGYAVSYSAGCDSTIALGETKTCTITNDDIAPVLTVVKHVINDNGGTKAAGDFSITVDDQGTNPASFAGAEAPGTDVTIDPGAYTVSEGPHAGYAVSYSAGCDSTLALGETKTCTITNDDIAPVLTVIKHVINDNGGTKAAGDFSITVDDQGTNPASFAGAESPGTDVVIDPGAYTVSEGPHAGYAVSYSAGCDSTLALGETKTCTITNDDVAPVLTVVKHVINDNGGTKAAGDFSITVDDQGTNPASFAGAEAPGTDVTIDPGAYTVAEGPHAGYAVSYSAGCDSTLALGETKTCTITNDDVAPVLTVVKHVINDNGGTKAAGDFSITVDDQGTNPASFAGAEAPGTDVVIDPGAYTVAEGAHAGYAVSYSAGCDSTLALGEAKTCTITNDDIAPVLTVVKHVVNDNGGTAAAKDFDITVDDQGTNPASFAGAEAPGTDVTIDPGAYTVAEGAHAGYAVTYSAGCDSTLAIGETKTCTITNDDIAATLTVIKHVVNDNGGTAAAKDFDITVDDQGTNPASFAGAEAPGTVVAVDPGAYSTSEGPHAGYDVSYSADCSSTLAIGENKTCTVTNDDIAPVLTVVKHVVNDNGGTAAANDFSITVDDQGTNPASFAGAEAPGTDVTIDPGAYGVTEGVHTGYAVSYSADCDSTIAIGETKTCTVTNDDIPAQITVIKHMVNDDGGTASSGDWNLHLRDGRVDVPGSPQAGSETGDTYTVAAGAYTVSESDGPAGYASSYSGDCGQQGHMTVALGETKTCTVTNDDIAPRLTVVKHVVNKGGSAATAADFQMDVRATDPSTAHFPGSEQGVTITLDAGDYSVDESGGPSTFAKELSADCSGAIAIGTEKTCTITNTKILPGGVVVKKGPAYAYHGDQLSFTFEVTNPGTTPLQNVVVTDDKCAPVVGPAQKLGGNADDLLDVGETWVYTCTMPVPAHSADDTSLVNVVTMSATDADGEPVGDTDQHTTRILHPAIAIDKSGPATAQAGQPVDYALVVTNPGDVPFLAANVNVGDALCEAPPLLITTNGDATPGQLDPGDTWAYMCRVRTLVGQTQINNVGVVTGTDSFGGHVVTDDDPATTTLTQPPAAISQAPAQVVAPAQSGVLGATAQSGTARLTGPSRCAKGPFEVKVAGRGIAQVRFALDGRTLKTVKAIAGRTVFKVKINPRGGGSKVHRVTARVTFTTASATKARTLRYVYLRCPQQAVLPQFTG